MAALMLFGVIYETYINRVQVDRYIVSARAERLLDLRQATLASQLKLDQKAQAYKFNEGYQTGKDVTGLIGGGKFSASFDASGKGVTSLTDPSTGTTISIKPLYAESLPRQDNNRLIYPITGRDAQRVYTVHAISVKEDIILNEEQGDTLTFKYELDLPSGTEAQMEPNGSVAVYGADSTLLGNVATGSEQDAKLLDQARKKADKTNLLFSFPAPFIREVGTASSKAKAWFSLTDDILTVHATNLKAATYPLSIDPSVYIETARKLMRGNNESNIDFDIDNELIQKGKTTGGRFDTWNSTLALPSARWNHATAAAGGNIYVMGGNDGTGAKGDLYWASFNTTTGAIESPNPGSGACASWCTNSAYNLPSGAVRQGASMVAYNSYLYLFGGIDGSGARTSTVYIAKLGANGEPQLWHPTDTNKNNWVYWYSSAQTLGAATSYGAAAAYNNRMYFVGGQTAAAAAGTTVVSYANIAPNGDLAAWSTTGMTALSTGVHSFSMQVYNDRMYVIGGANGTTTRNTVSYTKMNSDGTINAWSTTTPFTGARASGGGNFSLLWGGFIYVAAGCSTLNASGYCTAIASDIQLASINGDGTLTNWTTVSGVTSARMGYGFVAWRNRIYGVGGCTAQNTTTGACTTTATLTQYGAINQDGDASTVSTSVPNGTSPCATPTFTNCDMAPNGTQAGEGGRMAGATVINNGFIYYFGGCTAVSSGSVCFTGNAGKASGTVSYANIQADGSITRIPTCTGSGRQYAGSWCVDTANTINGATGLAAFGYAVFNNTFYAIGGTNGTQWQSNILRTTFNADGSWGTWSSQAFGGLSLGNARGYMYSFTRANPSSAGTYPGNLYVLGGCSGVTANDTGLDCSGAMYTEVYKCSIKPDTSIETTGSPCTTSGQLQLDAEPNTAGSQGLGVMAGTVYANYIYLIGGQSPNEGERGAVMYAKIDNSNNIVAVNGSIWTTSSNSINPVRRRGVAFGYNGYLYALAGYNVSSGGSLNDLLYAKINVSDGSIGTFTTSTVTVSARWDLRSAVNNGYVYAMGGCSAGAPPASCSAMTGTVQTFQLYNNYSGSPAGYTASSNLFATDRLGAGTTIYNGYIYVAGGCTSTTDCTVATTDVQYAALGADGSIGTWSTTTALPAARTWGKLLQAGGTLYYVGGQDSGGTTQSTVYYATPSSGSISGWSTATNGLPAARSRIGAASWGNRLYVTGGVSSGTSTTNTVYVSPQLSGGGDIGSAWSSSTGFNVARSGQVAVTYANNLYIFGGYDGSNYLNDAQYAQISSNGTIGSWTYTTSLPFTFRNGDGFAANGFMYVLGGRTADTSCTSHTFVAPISANTTIASGNNPTGVGEWYETSIRYSGNRYGAAAAYDQGRVYLLGGACGSTLTYTGTNRVVTSTLQAQPQIAKYSRMIDTDTDVFPTKWLMNGLDNSTGARWYMRYRSSTNAAATWGQETNYGQVSLGTPATYTPKDGAGANTSYARYYYLMVTIDSQQAYGYPEDVTRGPTIADLSLFYTADPSKRMLHGKTFTGGEQQPLDTPF